MAAPMQGELLKRGSARSLFGRKSWKRRYFVLDDEGCLQYYKSKEDFDRDPESRLKGRRIAVRSVHAEQHDVAELGGMPPGEHPARGLVLESDDGGVTLRVCGTDKDHAQVATTWIRALKSAGADAPGVPPQPPARVKPVTPPGEPESARPTAAAMAAAEVEAELDHQAAAAAEIEPSSDPASADPVVADSSPAAPPPAPPAITPTESTNEQASSAPYIAIDLVEDDAVHEDAEGTAEIAAADHADDSEGTTADDAAATDPEETSHALLDDGSAAMVEASTAENAEGDGAYSTLDLEAIEEHLAQELAAMAPPPDDRDDSDLQDATTANLQALYDWMDVNKDGVIQVVEFAKATSGKHRESMLACGKSLVDVSSYKM